MTAFSSSSLEVGRWSLQKYVFIPNIRSHGLWSSTFNLAGFWCNSFREMYWINAHNADDTFASRSDTSLVETRSITQKTEATEREGRRVGCRVPDICMAELQGPLGCLQIKGPLDSSHQTPSSRTPPFISPFIHPPKTDHYVDMLHDLSPGAAAMEGSSSTWRPGTGREIGDSVLGTHMVLLWKVEIVQDTKSSVHLNKQTNKKGKKVWLV